MLLLLLHGCILPVDGDVTWAETGEGAGNLSDGGFALDWWWGETWEGGACVELVLTNQDVARSDWLATVALSGDITSWIGGYGGASVTTSAPDEVRLEPASGSLAAWEAVEASFCAEPTVEPVSLLIFATDAADDPDSPDDTTTPETAISGAIYSSDEQFGLSYQGGADHGSTDAECLLMKFWNFTDSDAEGWRAEVTFSGTPQVDFSWSLTVFEDPDDSNTLHLYGTHGAETLPASSTLQAGLCMEPMVEPLSLSVHVP